MWSAAVETLGTPLLISLSLFSGATVNPSFGQLFPPSLEVTQSLVVKLWRSASTPRTSKREESGDGGLNRGQSAISLCSNLAEICDVALATASNRPLHDAYLVQGELMHL
jgi:hypothetical protein